MGRAKHTRFPQLSTPPTEEELESLALHSGFSVDLLRRMLVEGHGATPVLVSRLRKALHSRDRGLVKAIPEHVSVPPSRPIGRQVAPPDGYAIRRVPAAALRSGHLLLLASSGWLEVLADPTPLPGQREYSVPVEGGTVFMKRNVVALVATAVN